MSDKNNPKNIIEFYFLRSSAERFSSDLNHFAKEAQNFSDEHLYSIVSFCDYIRDNMAIIKKELEKRLDSK